MHKEEEVKEERQNQRGRKHRDGTKKNNADKKDIAIAAGSYFAMSAIYTLREMFRLTIKQANIILTRDNDYKVDKDDIISKEDIRAVCQQIITDSEQKLKIYKRDKNLFNLASLNTTKYFKRLRYSPFYYYRRHQMSDDNNINAPNKIANINKNNEDLELLYDVVNELDSMRNICSRICARHLLVTLAIEIVIFTVPIIALAAFMALSHSLLEDNYYRQTLMSGLYS